MKGKLLKDWSGFDHTNKKHQQNLVQALKFRIALQDKFPSQEFAKTLNVDDEKKFRKAHAEIQAAYQAFTTTGDFPPKAMEILEKYHALNNYDNGYEQIFDVRDYTGSRQGGFRLVNVNSGLTFEKIPIGAKITLKQMQGTEEYVFFDYYGGGLNWHRSLFENQDFWTLEDNALEFTNKAYYLRSSVHYQLLEAALNAKTCITLVDPGCDSCDAYAIALANAINSAAYTILNAVRNKGYGETPQSTLIILAPLNLIGAIRQALNVRLQAFGDSANRISYNFQPIYTLMLASTTQIGVFLPKIKIKSGYRMNLSTFTSFDMLTFSEAVAGWMAYGAAVGDTDQLECIDATAPSGVEGAPIFP